MLTNDIATTGALSSSAGQDRAVTPIGAQKVMIVDGSAGVMELLETVLAQGHYDVVFVESSEHAYSTIKRTQPNLVILCVSINDAAALQVLSMMKLDKDTRCIPVLTYTSECAGEDADEEPLGQSNEEIFTPSVTLRMN